MKYTNLEFTKIAVDVLHIFTTEHGIVIIICINILNVQQDIGEGLAEVIWSTARSLHGCG